MEEFDREAFLTGLNGKTEKEAFIEISNKAETLRQISEGLKNLPDPASQRKAQQYREWSDSLKPFMDMTVNFSNNPFIYP
ncbi:MAG TPA: hypothetical protein VF596_16290 [Pyrinomonadaceae bacterium]|jgi:hypothetical protein